MTDLTRTHTVSKYSPKCKDIFVKPTALKIAVFSNPVFYTKTFKNLQGKFRKNVLYFASVSKATIVRTHVNLKMIRAH